MLSGRRAKHLLIACALVVVADARIAVDRLGTEPEHLHAALRAAAASSAVSAESAEPAPTTTTPAPTTTVPPTTTTTIGNRMTSSGPWSLGPYRGTGVWIDVYDWTAALTNGSPSIGLDDIDRMADLGIQTVYIQTAHRRLDADVVEPDRLLPLIQRAHERGMAVVAWYLPMLEDVGLDLRRLVAASNLPVDGLGVDIESLAIADPAERTRRLLELSNGLRQAVGTKALSAIVQSPVVMQVVNPGFWPTFPWPEIGQLYDVVQPMSYWSERKPEWRSGERVALEDIDRIRASTGRPDMPINVAGGIANTVTLEDVAGMVRAVQSRGVLGASLYDWSTSQPAQWDLLRVLRLG
jgi:hypothetical protein